MLPLAEYELPSSAFTHLYLAALHHDIEQIRQGYASDWNQVVRRAQFMAVVQCSSTLLYGNVSSFVFAKATCWISVDISVLEPSDVIMPQI